MATEDPHKKKQNEAKEKIYPKFVNGIKHKAYGRYCLSHTLEAIDVCKMQYIAEGRGKDYIPEIIDYIDADDLKNPVNITAYQIQGNTATQLRMRPGQNKEVTNFCKYLGKNMPKALLYRYFCDTCHPTPFHVAFRLIHCQDKGGSLIIPKMICIPQECKLSEIDVVKCVAEVIRASKKNKNSTLQAFRRPKYDEKTQAKLLNRLKPEHPLFKKVTRNIQDAQILDYAMVENAIRDITTDYEYESTEYES